MIDRQKTYNELFGTFKQVTCFCGAAAAGGGVGGGGGGDGAAAGGAKIVQRLNVI